MDSDLQNPHHKIHLKPVASGLTRYQSAPSSYFSSFLDRELCEEFLNRPFSPEADRIFARFLANSDSLASQSLVETKQDHPAAAAAAAAAEQVQSSTGLFQQQEGFYQSRSRPLQPSSDFVDQNSGSGIDYRAATSVEMERVPHLKVGIGSSLSGANLVRHSSSPAGFLASINIGMENGYPVMGGMRDYGAVVRDASYSAAASRPRQPPPSLSGRMSPIPEIGSKNMAESRTEQVGGFGVANRGNNVTSFPADSWDDFADDDTSFSGLNESENQGGEAGTSMPRALAHHLSLHKTSAETAALEKILQFQDVVPCKTRAKRGFATHPRSIAERVRRTKISERMRKLQDLVPNMDKQTNTADMLDSAVDYIRELQDQVKGLQENRAKCMCANDTHQ